MTSPPLPPRHPQSRWHSPPSPSQAFLRRGQTQRATSPDLPSLFEDDGDHLQSAPLPSPRPSNSATEPASALLACALPYKPRLPPAASAARTRPAPAA